MDLQALFSAISKTIDMEALRGFHVLSITVSTRLPRDPLREQFSLYDIIFSSDLRPGEFCLSLRGSPTERRVNFYRVSELRKAR